jgi:Flp pilus assembly protein TadG
MQIDIDNAVASSGPRHGWLARFIRAFLHQQRAAVAPMMALMLIPIIGGVAYAVELGSWQYMQRSAQNAADSAALAAATVDSDTGTTSEIEARAAAREFGFVNGDGAETVTAGETACPAGAPVGATCYEAIVGTSMPISLSGVLGLSGNQAISARAVAYAGGPAGPGPTNHTCVTAKVSLITNGTPDANLAGCAVLSYGNMTCNGNGVQADFAVAGGTVTGNCASDNDNNLSGQTDLPADPYVGLASDIPSDPCAGNYPQASTANGPSKDTVVAANRLTGTYTGTITRCGDVQLTGNVSLTGTATRLIIYNGRLDLNDRTLATAAGANATVIFTGTNASGFRHYPTDTKSSPGGMLAIEAPSSGAWKGIAVYQNPAITNGVDFSYTGNNPAWKITGVIYLPNSTVSFSGIVNKADDGTSCQILFAKSITISGTGKIIGDITGCDAAGVDTVDVTVGPGTTGTRPKLVL